MERKVPSIPPRRWAEAAAIAALYIATGRLGFFTAIPPGNVTIVWPPSGIALAAVLLIGNRAALGIGLGAFLVNIWFFGETVNPLSPSVLAVSAAIAAGSTLQALLGASLIEGLTGSRCPFDKPRDVLKFAGIAAFACLIAATFGVTSLCLGGFSLWAAYPYTWWTWYLGDASGVILVTPLLLVLRRPFESRWGFKRWAEAVLFLTLLSAASAMVFWEKKPHILFQYPYGLLPFLIWAALRFERGGVAVSILVVSGMAVAGTVKGLGAFAGGTVNEALILLQSFLAIFTITGLVLAAAVAEYQRVEGALREAYGKLEQRVAERTSELAQANKVLQTEIFERRDLEERLRLFMANVEDYAIVMLDPEGCVASWNPGAERIKGYRVEEILGRHFSRFFTAEDARSGKPQRMIKDASAHGRVEDQGWLVRKDGSPFWADVVITALREEDGTLRGFAKVTRDLTERKRSEQELEESRSFLNSIVENIPDMIFIKDARDLRFVRFNKAGEELLGFTRESLIGQNDYDFFPKAEADFFTAKDREVLSDGALLDIPEEPIHTKGKGARILHTKKIPLRGPDGKPKYLLGISEDITERKQAEEALRRKTEELARSNAELELFASTASHDLQEPLRKIVIFGDLLKKHSSTGLDALGLDWLGRMQNAAERMSRLIQDLLTLARIVRDPRPLEPVDLNAVVKDVLRDLEARIAPAKAEIAVDKLPTLHAHPLQMRQLFQNLIGNALKFRRKGEPPRVVITSRDPANGFAEILVTDNGIGFAEKDAARVFEPFMRLNTRAEYEGNGIGLAICRKIMLRHGGWISAKSDPGKGSTFLIELPIRRSP